MYIKDIVDKTETQQTIINLLNPKFILYLTINGTIIANKIIIKFFINTFMKYFLAGKPVNPDNIFRFIMKCISAGIDAIKYITGG